MRQHVSDRCNVAAKVFVFAASAVMLLSGCGSKDARSQDAPIVGAASSLPAPAPEIMELSFMAGRWVAVNPNKSVAEEHWTLPAGKGMQGMFRIIRPSGAPSFFEVTAITVEPAGTFLRLRHFHAELDVHGEEKDANVFKLVSASDGQAVFEGVERTRGVARVIYRAEGQNGLSMQVEMQPNSGEKGYATRYARQ